MPLADEAIAQKRGFHGLLPTRAARSEPCQISARNLSLAGKTLTRYSVSTQGDAKVGGATVQRSKPWEELSSSLHGAFRQRRCYASESYSETQLLRRRVIDGSVVEPLQGLFAPFSQWETGMRHNIPVEANFTLFKYINITPSFNYTERWYTKKIMRDYDELTHEEVRDTINGFHRVYDYNMAVSMNTKLYGMYKPLFWKSKDITIRHVVTPSVSYTYTPDFGKSKFGYYETYTYTDENGEVRMTEYSPFEGMPYGVPGKGTSQTVAFSLKNNLEMKMASDKDTTGYKKISLIDDLSANLSYDIAQKRWSNLTMSARLKLTKSYTFNMNATFATYAYKFDENGRVVTSDRTEWSYGRFGRFQGYSGSFSYTLNNDTFKKWFGKGDDEDDKDKKDKKDGEGEDGEEEEESTTDQSKTGNRETQDAALDPDGYLAFNMPWSLSLSYSYSIRENTSAKINIKKMRYPYALTHSLNVSGNVKIGSRWNITYSSGYDFTSKEMSMTTVNITRDLHCFNMSCGLVFGPFTSYNFSIRANSSMLTDALKWDQRSNTGSQVTWY